ncbi:MAG: hypothetical protein J6U54_09985 [Clostridiales bacterium]|nr:hypothetical protein [Clostridiales bacterium]
MSEPYISGMIIPIDGKNVLHNFRDIECHAALIEQVDSGPKNIADGRRSNASTGGVAFTFADDGTFLADATATNKKSTSAIMLQLCTFTPKAGETYVLSGCPSGGATNSYALRVTTSDDTTLAWDTGSGVVFTASSSDPLIVKCSIKSGIVIDNMPFRPMICTKAAWDISYAYKAYVDYDDALVELVDSGPKNVLEMTQTQTSITRSNGNSSMTAVYDKTAGTITLTGTHYSADSAFAFEFYSGNAVDTRQIPAGTYHLSGCYPGGSTSTWRAVLTNISGAVDIGNGAYFTITEQTYCAYRILVSGNCTLDGAVFYPMVCPKSLWGVSKAFKPYRPSYQDLYNMVKALQNGT